MAESTGIVWKPYRPSNGTEGDIFRASWCDRCERDRLYRETGGNAPLNEDGSNGCSIIARTMGYDLDDPKYPKEWRRREAATEYPGGECTAFEPERAPGDTPSAVVRDELTKDLFA